MISVLLQNPPHSWDKKTSSEVSSPEQRHNKRQSSMGCGQMSAHEWLVLTLEGASSFSKDDDFLPQGRPQFCHLIVLRYHGVWPGNWCNHGDYWIQTFEWGKGFFPSKLRLSCPEACFIRKMLLYPPNNTKTASQPESFPRRGFLHPVFERNVQLYGQPHKHRAWSHLNSFI